MGKPSILPGGMRLMGDVEGDEDFVIFGTLDGQVNVGGAVVIETTGTVRGNVRGRTVAVRGVVVGDASATEAIRVDDGGQMVGDVHAPRVNIVKGARFRGHVHMVGARGGAPERAPRQPRASERPRRTRGVKAARTEQPTVPGSVRGLRDADTVPGSAPAEMPVAEPHAPEADVLPRRPPPPRIPKLRRARARRRD